MSGGASGYFKKLVVLVREHVTSAMIGGLVLMLTGFSPEDWFVEAMHAIHLPKAWPLGIDPRILLVTLGVAIIVGDQLFRRRPALQAELAGAGHGIAASPQAVVTAQELASTPALALPETPSIAVLPFDNISDDAAQEYFSDGMVEDIISGLSRVKWLFVIARNSSFTYKGKAVDVKQVGRELGVRYVLEGSLRKSADRLRITAQLIELRRARMCGLSAMIARPTTFSRCRTKLHCPSWARSSRACVAPRSSVSSASGLTAWMPMISSCRLSPTSTPECRSAPKERSRRCNARSRLIRLMRWHTHFPRCATMCGSFAADFMRKTGKRRSVMRRRRLSTAPMTRSR